MKVSTLAYVMTAVLLFLACLAVRGPVSEADSVLGITPTETPTVTATSEPPPTPPTETPTVTPPIELPEAGQASPTPLWLLLAVLGGLLALGAWLLRRSSRLF